MNTSLQFDSLRKICTRPRTALRLATVALLGSSLLLGATAARAEAAASAIVVKTEVLATPVTYSRPTATDTVAALPTWAAWKVQVANNGNNVVNSIVFSGETKVLKAGEFAEFLTTESLTPGHAVTCNTTNALQTAVSCNLGTLRSGGDLVEFVLIFKGPVEVLPVLAEDRIDFDWRATYAEALSNNPQAARQDTQTGRTIPATELGTSLPTQVKSTVPRTGGKFFTGDTGVATTADPWTTTVVVPSRLTYTTALIEEFVDVNSCSADLLTCNLSSLTIPGSFAFLQITLRRDTTTIKPGAKIANATIYYRPTPTLVTPEPDSVPVLDCTVTGGPQLGVPCIESRKAYTKKNAPIPTLEWEGDWEFVIHALDNGQYRG